MQAYLAYLLIQDLKQRGHEIVSNLSPTRRSAIVSSCVAEEEILRVGAVLEWVWR